MANDATRTSILHELISDAGIPISGISVVDINAVPPQVQVQYQPEATAEQITLGNQIVANFDWRRRRALARNTVVTALQNLTTAERNAILLHFMADYLRNHPQLAAKIATFLGVGLTVDEVDPN